MGWLVCRVFRPALQNGCYGIMQPHASCCCSNVLGLEVIDMAVRGHGPHQTSDWVLPNFERVTAGREKKGSTIWTLFWGRLYSFLIEGVQKTAPIFSHLSAKIWFWVSPSGRQSRQRFTPHSCLVISRFSKSPYFVSHHGDEGILLDCMNCIMAKVEDANLTAHGWVLVATCISGRRCKQLSNYSLLQRSGGDQFGGWKRTTASTREL